MTSTFPTANPRSATSWTARRRQLDAVGAFPARIGIGKVPTDVAEGRRSENGVGDRVTDDVRVRVAERTAIRRDGDAAEDERPAGDQPMKVVARAGAASTGGQRLRGPRISVGGLRCDRFGDRQVVGGRYLDVRCFAIDETDRQACQFDERGLIGGVDAFARADFERAAQHVALKRLRRLREVNALRAAAFRRRTAHPLR